MSADQTIQTNSTITIRRVDLTDPDRAALRALTERDTHERELDGPVIGIEVEDRLLAALSLSTGESIADPFSRTDELRRMLELRAAQITRRTNGHRRGLRIGRRGPALGGSPAGQILTLPRWG